MTLQEKKALFELLREQKYILTDEQNAKDILDIALSELGNLDPYIRDSLALETAAYMVYKDYLSESEISDLAKRLLSDEFLFYGLKDKSQDSVFKRTFTALMIAMLYRIPNKDIPLSEKEQHTLYEQFLVYLESEYDYRGFVETKGWAHFFAHSSDVMRQFFAQPAFDDKWVDRYLKVVSSIIQNDDYVFHHNEDERFKNAFVVLLERDDINEELLISFIKKLGEYPRKNTLPEDLNSYVNVKNILHELYFATTDDKSDLNDIIKHAIDTLTVNGK